MLKNKNSLDYYRKFKSAWFIDKNYSSQRKKKKKEYILYKIWKQVEIEKK